MTHCEKCIHYDMCKAEHDSLDGTVLSFFPNNSDCQFFKNKADFVEVVRCKDCLHKINYKGRAMCTLYAEEAFGVWYGLNATRDEHFCSYGERRDT